MTNPSDILATIPGWEGARWSRLAGGTNRRVFRVSNGDAEAVLKIGEGVRGAPYNSFQEEAAVQSTAAEAGLAPRVLHVASGAYLMAFVCGEGWEGRHFDQRENLLLLAATLKRVHALPATGRLFPAREAAQIYARRIDATNAATIALCLELVETSPRPQTPSCCHNDVVAANIISTPELKLIDWEYACDNDAFFDLATVVEHHDLSDEQTTILMASYTGNDDQGWRDHLAEQRRLYLALVWLWMSQREECDAPGLERVAEKLLTSCS